MFLIFLFIFIIVGSRFAYNLYTRSTVKEGRSMELTQDQKDLLEGRYGPGAQLAMKVQTAIGESFGAKRMVPMWP